MRSLRLCLAPQLVQHLFKQGLHVPSAKTLQRSRLELDMATMMYSRNFILSAQTEWFIHLRADSSPQGGRDYFVCEFDWCPIKTINGHASTASSDDEPEHVLDILSVKTRILPLSIIGSRAGSSVHKGQQLLKSLSMDSDSLPCSIARCMSLMFDFGAESGHESWERERET